ncbi:MAG: hypothetical protein HYY06_20930 [Deltaproteobacteria bacterium]|nr:hypothetical protein [Deltaproteobacteria bacterium]
MRKWSILALMLLEASQARAAERELTTIAAFCQVCRAARPTDRVAFPGDAFQRGQARMRHAEARLQTLETLYRATLPQGAFRFGEYDFESGVLPVDTRHAFRFFGGVVTLYTSSNEPIAFEVEPDRARALVDQVGRGRARLVIGFLVAFDDTESDPCLVRPSGSMAVRADLAFSEVVDPSGRVLARMQTERLDEVLPSSPPEPGPGGSAQSPTMDAGSVTVAPPTVTGDARRRAAIDAFIAGGGATISALVRPCRAVGARAGGRTRGSLVVAMDVDAAGAVSGLRVEVDSIGNGELARCVVERMGGLRYPGGSGRGRVQVSLPLMFTDE